MFRPKEIRRLVVRKAKPWSEKQKAALRQERLNLGDELLAELKELEQIPWTFSYEFACDEESCTGHTIQVFGSRGVRPFWVARRLGAGLVADRAGIWAFIWESIL